MNDYGLSVALGALTAAAYDNDSYRYAVACERVRAACERARVQGRADRRVLARVASLTREATPRNCAVTRIGLLLASVTFH